MKDRANWIAYSSVYYAGSVEIIGYPHGFDKGFSFRKDKYHQYYQAKNEIFCDACIENYISKITNIEH